MLTCGPRVHFAAAFFLRRAASASFGFGALLVRLWPRSFGRLPIPNVRPQAEPQPHELERQVHRLGLTVDRQRSFSAPLSGPRLRAGGLRHALLPHDIVARAEMRRHADALAHLTQRPVVLQLPHVLWARVRVSRASASATEAPAPMRCPEP